MRKSTSTIPLSLAVSEFVHERCGNGLLAAALHYHRTFGWCIVPAIASYKGLPAGFKGTKYQTVRSTEAELTEWFSSRQYDALAVMGGAVSNDLVMLDLDRAEVCEWWNANHAHLGLPTEATARPGLHIAMRWRNCRSQKNDKTGVEIRAQKLITLITPSPGKRWLVPPNGEIPFCDPYCLGLEHFGIEKAKNFSPGDVVCDAIEKRLGNAPTFVRCAAPGATLTHSGENPNLRDRTRRGQKNQKMASVSSVPPLEDQSESLQTKIEAAINKTIPAAEGQRNRCILALCQWLKAIPELRDRPAGELKPIVQKWHALALPFIQSKLFEETWEDFAYGWKRVKWPKGTLLNALVQKALEDTENPPEAADYEDPRTQLLVRVCWQFQQVSGQEPFFMAVRTAAGIMGLSSHDKAGRRLEMLMADEILVIAEPHTSNKATRYYYIGGTTL
jgi:hypothetical protein